MPRLLVLGGLLGALLGLQTGCLAGVATQYVGDRAACRTWIARGILPGQTLTVCSPGTSQADLQFAELARRVAELEAHQQPQGRAEVAAIGWRSESETGGDQVGADGASGSAAAGSEKTTWAGAARVRGGVPGIAFAEKTSDIGPFLERLGRWALVILGIGPAGDAIEGVAEAVK